MGPGPTCQINNLSVDVIDALLFDNCASYCGSLNCVCCLFGCSICATSSNASFWKKALGFASSPRGLGGCISRRLIALRDAQEPLRDARKPLPVAPRPRCSSTLRQLQLRLLDYLVEHRSCNANNTNVYLHDVTKEETLPHEKDSITKYQICAAVQQVCNVDSGRVAQRSADDQESTANIMVNDQVIELLGPDSALQSCGTILSPGKHRDELEKESGRLGWYCIPVYVIFIYPYHNDRLMQPTSFFLPCGFESASFWNWGAFPAVPSMSRSQ